MDRSNSGASRRPQRLKRVSAYITHGASVTNPRVTAQFHISNDVYVGIASEGSQLRLTPALRCGSVVFALIV